jgi:hypothetical protein
MRSASDGARIVAKRATLRPTLTPVGLADSYTSLQASAQHWLAETASSVVGSGPVAWLQTHLWELLASWLLINAVVVLVAILCGRKERTERKELE